jgi:acyl carrier protein
MKSAAFLNVIAAALTRAPNTVTIADSRKTLPEWDSLGHLAILSAIENQVGVSVEEEELQRFSSVREIVERLQARGVLED